MVVTRGLERGGRATGMVVKGLEVCGKWVVGWERSSLTRRTRSRSGGVHCKCVMVARGLLLVGRQVGMCVWKIFLWLVCPSPPSLASFICLLHTLYVLVRFTFTSLSTSQYVHPISAGDHKVQS